MLSIIVNMWRTNLWEVALSRVFQHWPEVEASEQFTI